MSSSVASSAVSYQPFFEESQLKPGPSPEAVSHLKKVVAEFNTAILVTHKGTSSLHGRPMSVAAVDDDLSIWLITNVDSTKVREVSADERSLLLFQSSKRYASLNGVVETIRDRDKVRQLWKEAYNVWYKSENDPEIVLLRFTPIDAEYWDSSGTSGIAYAFHALRAYVTGERIKMGELSSDPDVHAKLELA